MEILNRVIKKIWIKFVYHLGLYQHFGKASNDTVSVFSYHCVYDNDSSFEDYCYIKQSEFDIQMKHLKSEFSVISIEDDFTKKSTKPKAIITFDDGFMNNYEFAYPILKKYKLPFCIYLSTGFIDSGNTIWFARLIRIISKTKHKILTWGGSKYDLSNVSRRFITCTLLQRELKKRRSEVIDVEIKVISEALEVSEDLDPESDKTFTMLHAEAIQEMLSSGLASFGAHTHDHTILSKLNFEMAKKQIDISIQEVERLTGKPCITFAYPNGGKDDFQLDHVEYLRNLGVAKAVTMCPGLANVDSDPLLIPRQFVSSNMNIKKFKMLANGII